MLQRSTLADVLPNLTAGLACFQLFVGLRGSDEELGVKKQNHWCFTKPHLDEAVEEYMTLKPEEVMESDVPLMFVSFPSAKVSFLSCFRNFNRLLYSVHQS